MRFKAKRIGYIILSLFMLLMHVNLQGKEAKMNDISDNQNYFYDAHRVRYELYQANGGKSYNWLFLPGGPGADSSYFKSLIDNLTLPGNVWLIDLPGNGSNTSVGAVNFDMWMDIFPAIVQKFENPILVGHSFGGMFPLLFPELENSLKGFIILNSAPSLWLEEAVAYSKQFTLPDLSKEMQDFTERPSQETFEVALDACMPYYFPPVTLEIGRALLTEVPFQYLPAVWWQRKAIETNFSAKWVPLDVPTLIVGAKFDCICPVTLFQNDKRFDRPNIDFLVLEDAGHIPWIENLTAIKNAFDGFIVRLDDVVIACDKSHSKQSAFAVIYRGYVKPDKESEYINYWNTVADYFVKERGALGSTLHKTADNMWVAYSRWPDKESRDASWPSNEEQVNSDFPVAVHEAINGLKACLDIEKQLPEISMSIEPLAKFQP